MKNGKENKMGYAPVFKLILSMSLPAMFSMIIQSLYNIVDSMFVSMYSRDGLTAVSLAYPLQMLLIAVAVGTGVGINSLVSRKLGEKNQKEADSAATHGLVMGVFNWIIFLILGLTVVKPFINAFTDNPTVAQMGMDYLSVVMIYSFGCFVEVIIEKTLQATGNMIFPMIFMITGAVINIALDPVFIFVLDMGVKGAAIATVLGQIISMAVALCVLFAKKHAVKVSFRNVKFSMMTVKNIYAVGIPSIVMQSITSLMLVLVNLILKKFENSDIAISVLNVYFKLQSFVFMPCFGLNQGLLPIMGYNYGARNKERLIQTLKYGIAIAFCIMSVGFAVFMAVPDVLLSMFNADKEMMEIGCVALRIICPCFLPASVGIIFISFFQATGHGMRSMMISMLRQLVVLVPSAFALSYISLNAVWFAFPVAEVMALLFAVLLFTNLYQKEIKTLGN